MKKIRAFKNKKIIETKNAIAFAGAVLYVSLTQGLVANASSGGDIVSSAMNGIFEVMMSFVTSIGGLITLWGIFELGQSMQSTDGGQQSTALKRLSGGLLMTIAPLIYIAIKP